jgi:hypothetical protein
VHLSLDGQPVPLLDVHCILLLIGIQLGGSTDLTHLYPEGGRSPLNWDYVHVLNLIISASIFLQPEKHKVTISQMSSETLITF